VGSRATPSPTAWEAIQTRITEQADQPEMEIIMLEKAPPPAARTCTGDSPGKLKDPLSQTQRIFVV